MLPSLFYRKQNCMCFTLCKWHKDKLMFLRQAENEKEPKYQKEEPLNLKNDSAIHVDVT